MKAITVKQPWGSLMFTPVYGKMGTIERLGLKTMETRKWPTRFRGDLLITTSQKHERNYSPILENRGTCRYCGCTNNNACNSFEMGSCYWVTDNEDICSCCDQMEMNGFAIGVVEVVDCRPMTIDDERHAGCELYEGAYCFYLQNARAIKPFPIKGKLGIWSLDIEDQLKIKVINQPVHSLYGEVPFSRKLVPEPIDHG